MEKRIFQTQKKHDKLFDKHLIAKERKLPRMLILQGLLYGFIKQPIHSFLYLLLHAIVQQWSLRQPINTKQVFEVSKSTKALKI